MNYLERGQADITWIVNIFMNVVDTTSFTYVISILDLKAQILRFKNMYR